MQAYSVCFIGDPHVPTNADSKDGREASAVHNEELKAPRRLTRGLEVAAVLLVAVLDPGVVREGERPAAAGVLALEAFLRQVVVRL